MQAGRYQVGQEIAAGGMATVHLGRLVGPAGFTRTVAIKRPLVASARDPRFVAMFVDEARVASRIRHPNVVSVLDVEAVDGELLLVMDYIHGVSLSELARLLRKSGESMPPAVASAIVLGLLHGLGAAHEATSEKGEPLGIVHRDVSPSNVLVGVDGVARVADFGIARASSRIASTREGQLKGKLAYMAPERLSGDLTTQRSDLYSAGVVLWQALTGRHLFTATSEAALAEQILLGDIDPPSRYAAGLPEAVDDVVLRSVHHDAGKRFEDARDFAAALEKVLPPASPLDVAALVERVAGITLAARAAQVREFESRPVDQESAPESAGWARNEAPTRVEVVRPAGRRGAPLRAALVAGGGVALLLLAFVRMVPRHATPSFASAQPLVAASPPVASAQEASPPPATLQPSPLPVVAAPPAEPPPTIPPAKAAVHPRSRVAGGPQVDCSVPYELTASGKRVYKRACL